MDNLNGTSNLTGNVLLAINQTDNFTTFDGFLGALKRIENFTSISELLDVYNLTTIEDFTDAMRSDLNNLNNSYIWEIYKNLILTRYHYNITDLDDYLSFAHNISDFIRGYSNTKQYNSTISSNEKSNLTNIQNNFLPNNLSLTFTVIEGFLSALKRIGNFTSIGELQDIYNSTSIEDLIITMSSDLKILRNFPLSELLGDIFNITDMDDYFDSANSVSHFESFTRTKLIICSQDLDIDVPWETDPPGECERERMRQIT